MSDSQMLHDIKTVIKIKISVLIKYKEIQPDTKQNEFLKIKHQTLGKFEYFMLNI